jgi:carbon monoxide dehydrogenase subunit G
MTVTVAIDLGYEFAVKAPFKDVWAVLSDVPTSVSYFPQVDQLIDLGGGVYRWEMEKIGTAQANIQTIYASKYVSDRAQGSVRWTPVAGQGNALVGGSWQVTDRQSSTALVFSVQGTVDVPLPGLMKLVVVPVVRSEFEKLVEQYIDALIERFGGEV